MAEPAADEAEPKEPAASTDTVRRIEDAGLKLFAEYGYHAASMRQIADAAAVRPASVYHWFDSKEALIASIMRQFMTGLTREVVTAIDDKSSPVERLEAAVWTHVVYHGTHRRAAFVTDTEVRALTGERREEILQMRDGYEQILLQIVRDGVEAGVLHCRNAAIAVKAILLECTGVAVWFRPSGELSLQVIADMHAELVLASLGAKDPARYVASSSTR